MPSLMCEGGNCFLQESRKMITRRWIPKSQKTMLLPPGSLGVPAQEGAKHHLGSLAILRLLSWRDHMQVFGWQGQPTASIRWQAPEQASWMCSPTRPSDNGSLDHISPSPRGASHARTPTQALPEFTIHKITSSCFPPSVVGRSVTQQ